MPNQATAARVVCPFYLRDKTTTLVCEGIKQNDPFALRFRERADKVRWMCAYCEKYEYAKACPNAKQLMEIYENESSALAN